MEIGDQIVFLGYADQPSDCFSVFDPGDLCSVTSLEPDGIVRCCSLSSNGALEHGRKDILFAEEFILLARYRGPSTSLKPRRQDWRNMSAELNRVLETPRSKEYSDFRDRISYVFVTGTFPSHLRPFFTRLLASTTSMHNKPVSLDGRSGLLKIDEDLVEHMALENHPMVIKVREYLACGWRIQVSKGPNSRKPFSKILVHKGDNQKTIQIDGSVKDGWS